MVLCGLTNRSSLARLALPLAGGMLLYRGLSGKCDVYRALGVNTAARGSSHASLDSGEGVRVEHAVTIRRPASELYRYWRRLDQLPRFMHHLEEVRPLGGRRSHWVARGPLGVHLEWDADVINDRRDELIAWRSALGSQVDTAGSVHFTPRGDGSTEVRVNLRYDPPGGKLGAAVARLLGEAPEQQVREDLERFKQMMESTRAPVGAAV